MVCLLRTNHMDAAIQSMIISQIWNFTKLNRDVPILLMPIWYDDRACVTQCAPLAGVRHRLSTNYGCAAASLVFDVIRMTSDRLYLFWRTAWNSKTSQNVLKSYDFKWSNWIFHIIRHYIGPIGKHHSEKIPNRGVNFYEFRAFQYQEIPKRSTTVICSFLSRRNNFTAHFDLPCGNKVCLLIELEAEFWFFILSSRKKNTDVMHRRKILRVWETQICSDVWIGHSSLKSDWNYRNNSI